MRSLAGIGRPNDALGEQVLRHAQLIDGVTVRNPLR